MSGFVFCLDTSHFFLSNSRAVMLLDVSTATPLYNQRLFESEILCKFDNFHYRIISDILRIICL